MNEKKADNSVIEYKKESNYIFDRISESKKAIGTYDDIEEELVSLNKKMSKLIELLNESIKGKQTKAKLEDIDETRFTTIKKVLSETDEYIEEERNNIKKLYKEKDRLEKEHKKEIKEELKEEEKEV